VLGLEKHNLDIQSRWFSGGASILTYSLDELLGTKMRALYQRKKGRDLFDLWQAALKEIGKLVLLEIVKREGQARASYYVMG